MLRPRLARAGRSFYDILGVSAAASTDDIKRAFREKAKQTHPDTAGGNAAAKQFRDMVEAYRVLRDPKRRAEYDGQSERQSTGAQDTWPRGHGENMSENFRSTLYGQYYQKKEQTSETQHVPGFQRDFGVVGALAFTGLFCWALTQTDSPDQKHIYPSGKMSAKVVAGSSMSAKGSSTSGSIAVADVPEGADNLVRAYYNPFSEVWQRLPEGYEPPGTMDLTAWHKQRADPNEWSRLFVDGKLSQIIPRGGLQVQYRPAYETHEAILVKDPLTRKTMQVTEKLPPRGKTHSCGVEF